MDHAEATSRLLDAADALFYDRGIQAVGMDEIRAASGVSLKRLYRCFPSKERLVVAYLRRRDLRWREDLAGFVEQCGRPDERVLAVFDWLYEWFSRPGFRGCAFLNSFGELGATAPAVAEAARDHKHLLQRYLTGLARDTGTPDPAALAAQLLVLIDGAISVAAVTADPTAAHHARTAAKALLSGREWLAGL
ncbi:TetR/AcrR family transcriptional regulator [Pseudonocardia acaciae]|uniref:TetR/AcrR family transcriptional regulator n=1 Tax=Pseudonocardia acaciae TaxID=551276 RepID=UPI00048E6259|nr:TetR/AcrR family transcriptional regulator [Pseudonocardia acaciae]